MQAQVQRGPACRSSSIRLYLACVTALGRIEFWCNRVQTIIITELENKSLKFDALRDGKESRQRSICAKNAARISICNSKSTQCPHDMYMFVRAAKDIELFSVRCSARCMRIMYATLHAFYRSTDSTGPNIESPH